MREEVEKEKETRDVQEGEEARGSEEAREITSPIREEGREGKET